MVASVRLGDIGNRRIGHAFRDHTDLLAHNDTWLSSFKELRAPLLHVCAELNSITEGNYKQLCIAGASSSPHYAGVLCRSLSEEADWQVRYFTFVPEPCQAIWGPYPYDAHLYKIPQYSIWCSVACVLALNKIISAFFFTVVKFLNMWIKLKCLSLKCGISRHVLPSHLINLQ